MSDTSPIDESISETEWGDSVDLRLIECAGKELIPVRSLSSLFPGSPFRCEHRLNFVFGELTLEGVYTGLDDVVSDLGTRVVDRHVRYRPAQDVLRDNQS